MYMRIIRTSLVLILFTPFLLYAQNAPKYSNEFMAIGVGANAFGMANACVAGVSDATAGYWNPAGLTRIQNDLQLGLMHSEYFAGLAKYDYGAIARRLDSSGVFALSFIRLGVDNIPNTTELIDAAGNIDYDKITMFSAADYAFLISYARKTKVKGLSVGGNAKVIRRVIGDFAGAWGFGLDAGAQYEVKGIQFGLMARDISTTFNAWTFNLTDEMKEVFKATGNDIPTNSIEITLPRVILAIGGKTELAKNLMLHGEINTDLTFDEKRNVLFKGRPMSGDPHFGVAFGYKEMLFLRAGIMNIQSEVDLTGVRKTTVQPNFGVGIKLRKVSFDYARTDIGDASAALYSNIISLRIDIDRQPK